MKKEQLAMWYAFLCPECENYWEEEHDIPDRAWCNCGTATEPELLEND